MTALHWRLAVGSVGYRIWKYICQLWDRQPPWTQILREALRQPCRFSIHTTLVILSAPGGLAAVNDKLQYFGMFFLSFS
jgi:hypothetical protein